MRTEMKVVRRGDEISLIAANSGRGFMWLLMLELAVFAVYFVKLISAVGYSDELLWPAIPSLTLVAWTWWQMKPDFRIVINTATRRGLLLRIDPVRGTRELARFGIDDIEGFSLRQIRDWEQGARHNEYIVDLELRGGRRHVLSARGPLLAYDRALAEISRMTGVGRRVVPMPAT